MSTWASCGAPATGGTCYLAVELVPLEVPTVLDVQVWKVLHVILEAHERQVGPMAEGEEVPNLEGHKPELEAEVPVAPVEHSVEHDRVPDEDPLRPVG